MFALVVAFAATVNAQEVTKKEVKCENVVAGEKAAVKGAGEKAAKKEAAGKAAVKGAGAKEAIKVAGPKAAGEMGAKKEACEKAGIQIKHFYCIKNSDPRLVKIYYEALRQRSDMDVEKVREDVLTCNKDTAFPAKVKTDYIKWHAGKVNPEVYGDVDNRPPVNLEIKIGGELLTVSGAGGSKK